MLRSPDIAEKAETFTVLVGCWSQRQTEPTVGDSGRVENHDLIYVSSYVPKERPLPLREKEKEFQCVKRVYVSIDPEEVKGRDVVVEFYDPDGNLRERPRLDSDGVKQKLNSDVPINFFINFHKSLLGGYKGFIGKWKVDVFVDGRSFGTETFSFSC